MLKGKFKVGDGATVCDWTDRRACTVEKVTKNSLTLRRDRVERLTKPEWQPGGFSAICTNNDNIKYNCYHDETNYTMVAYWSEKKQGYYVDKTHKVIEGKHEYYDYNF